jgi:hypothetical protein
VIGLGAAVYGASAPDPVRYSRRSVAGADLHVIDVNLNDRRAVVSPEIAAGGIGRAEQFSSMVRRVKPVAAINGTFFSKRTLRPVADIAREGKAIHFGGIGTAVAFARDGVDFVRLPKSRRVDWSEHRAALAGGPLLVWEGFAKPLPGGEGFGDPHVFARAAPRTAIGITKGNHLLLVTTAKGCSLAKLAKALRAMGAVYAFNLDGGASAAMWHRGRMIASPKRPLTNILCVYVKPEPVSTERLRPPQGLDWRGGHSVRPTISFRARAAGAGQAGEMRVWVKLPRRWSAKQSLLVSADRALPAGWAVAAKLDGEPVGSATALPAEIAVDLSGCHSPKHVMWIGMVDEEGKTVGWVDRFFKPGTVGREGW